MMELFRRICLLLLIVGGLNWGIYGLCGANFVGWLLGGTAGLLARAVFVLVGLAALGLLPSLFTGWGERPADANTGSN